MPKKKPHEWAPIAPEYSADEGVGDCIWKWCIRCGCMKLGGGVFVPGPEQKKVLVSSEDPGCKEG